MAGYQDLLDSVARVVGGTAPDPTNRPRWFSGDQAGDTTGVQVLYGPSFKGCYSSPEGFAPDVPVGLVLPGPFRRTLASGPPIEERDRLRILILTGMADYETDYQNIEQFRDLVPQAFESHMQIYGTAAVVQAFVTDGKPIQNQWGDNQFVGWEFTLEVMRFRVPTLTP